MAEHTRKYKGKTERLLKVAEMETQGYRMLEDNFVKSWRPGKEIEGTMLFTNIHPVDTILPPVRDLEKEIDELKERLNKAGVA